VKLASVASDVLGRSGREMLEALVAGETDVAAMAELARGKMREKRATLERALAGRFGPHQRFLVAETLAHIDFLEETIDRLSTEIGERERPFEIVLDRLDTIPGVGRRTAEIIVAEVGSDVRRFPSAGHLVSWAGLSPGRECRQEAAQLPLTMALPGSVVWRSVPGIGCPVTKSTRTP
jgi:transposase